MDYTIYIVLGVLVVVYFLTKALNRKNSKNRKSRRFMDGHRQDKQHRTTRKGDS